MMMQMFQSDPRLMMCFQVLTGINLTDIQEQQMKANDKAEDEKKQRKKEAEERLAEQEKKAKEEAEAALPEEEKAKIALKKEAEAIKAKGNEFYKKRDFINALKYYQEAIDKNPSETTFYSNKAACFFETRDFDKCIEACEEGLAVCKGENYDFAKLGKILARKANALSMLGKFDESIDCYQSALLEHNDPKIKYALQQAKKSKNKAEADAYIDPEKAMEHKEKGSNFFREGKYPEALKEYEEGLKRDPKCVAIYSNRCATWIKLMEFVPALKDAEKCLEIDPTFIKAYARKGTCHQMMKEYHKALKCYDEGLKLDPNNKDLIDGKQKTMMTIQMSAGSG